MSNKELNREELLEQLALLRSSLTKLNHQLEEESWRHSLVEETLQKREKQARALIEAIPDFVFRINNKGIYIDCKSPKDDLFEQTGPVIGKKYHDFAPPDFAELIDRKITETLATGQMQIFDYTYPGSGKRESGMYEIRMVPSGSDEVTAIARNITSERNAGKKLRERETNARAIIDASSDVLFLLDKDGIVIDCNEAFAAYFNETPASMAGKCIFSYLPGNESVFGIKTLRQIFERKAPFAGEAVFRERVVRYSAFPVNNEHESVEKVAVYAHDSTEQLATLKALEESEEIFRSFMENSPIYVFFKDKECRLIRLSSNFEEMLGCPVNEAVKKTMHELFPAELAERKVKDDLRVLKEGKPLEVDEDIRDRNFYTIKFPVFIDKKVKYIAGYTIDVTDQKHAEQALRESEERFRKVYAEGTFPIAMLNKDFLFINANRVFQETFGYPEDELRTMSFRDITHPAHLANDIRNLDRLIIGEIEVYSTEKRYITRQNEIVWGNARVSIVRDNRNSFLYFLVIIDNITKYKLAEAEIRAKNLQLERMNAEKDKFFSILAHDLRSPFNSFLGLTEMMADDSYSMSPEEIRHIATNLRNSAGNLYSLLENLLEWAMIQRGITAFEPGQLKLMPLINDSLMTIHEQARNKSIRMQVSVSDNHTVTADKNMLATVLRNLLSNAVKFTPKGGSVFIYSEQIESDWMEVSIRDTGIGMEEDMVKSLFDLDNQNNRRGTDGELSTGLGLLLCKEFIEKHGGAIRVESEPGKGSAFFIRLKQ